MSTAMLEIEDLIGGYGATQVLHGLSVQVGIQQAVIVGNSKT